MTGRFPLQVHEEVTPMTKISVRKAGAIRLTSACPYNPCCALA